TSEPYTYNIDLSSLSSEARSNGSHQITVHGFDSTGSTSSVYVTVNLKGNTAVKPSVSPSVTKTP
ncbi:hypothetical protein CO179_03350, partial [candidate division WWE3 bacterium CG_4_9_14_3_um_filter_39_7]